MHRLYFFESALTPNMFRVDLKAIDFSQDSDVRKLDLGKDESNVFAGDIAGDFVNAEPSAFLGV